MRKEDINTIAQILTSMNDSAKDIEIALKNKDISRLNEAKSRLLRLQLEIERRI